ncbi:MAG: hemolysin family protein [Bryobacteraceae bacterium]
MPYRLLITVAIVVVNGFFAAAEVSLVSSRRSRLKALADQGNVGASAAISLLENPSRLLSVTQFGVTLASLGLGWAGEEPIYHLVVGWLEPFMTPALAPWIHGGSFGIAFLLISFAHVVLGEVLPKNLAIEKAERLAVLMAPPLLVFNGLSRPLVYVIERTSSALSRLIGLKGTHSSGGHSAEELKYIVSSSRTEGHLEGFEEAAIQNLLELGDISAREVMIPRNDMVAVPVDTGLDELLRIAIEHKYSRLPVYEGSLDNITGVVHYKDLMRAWQERKLAADRFMRARPFELRRFVRPPLVVPESKPLNQLIDEFRKKRAHLAMVVDEHGTIAGMVTLEDVLEQVFGEMADEHDVQRHMPSAGAKVIVIDGSTTIRDLASQYHIELPGDAGFETLAGFLLFQLGELPARGTVVRYGTRKFTVLEMEKNRIAKVRIDRDEPTAVSA